MTRLPAHEALSRWAYPLGKREPNAEDKRKAALFFDEMAKEHGSPRVGPWAERDRSKSIRQLATLFMAKREEAEWRKATRETERKDAA